MTKENQELNQNLKTSIIEALREVYDPEIPINVYDLGLIYDIQPNKGQVHITMSLTSPTCPTAEYIQEMISSAVSAVDGVKDVEIELTFEPRWTPDRVSDDAKEELGIQPNQENKIDPAITNVFGEPNKPSKPEILCNKCMISEHKTPLIQVQHKGKQTHYCQKCLSSF